MLLVLASPVSLDNDTPEGKFASRNTDTLSQPESSQQTVTKFNTNTSKDFKATRLHIRICLSILDSRNIAILPTEHLGHSTSP